MFKDIIATVAEAIEDGISVTEAKDNCDRINVDTVETTIETRSKTYSSSQDRHNKKRRLKTSALGTAIIGNSMENSGALDISTPSTNKTKGKTCNIDLISVIWMQLIAERDLLKPVDLSELKNARIRSVFPIVRCINNKDITPCLYSNHSSQA